jgi:hypothetical protein
MPRKAKVSVDTSVDEVLAEGQIVEPEAVEVQESAVIREDRGITLIKEGNTYRVLGKHSVVMGTFSNEREAVLFFEGTVRWTR